MCSTRCLFKEYASMILYVLRFKSFHPCASVSKIRRRQKSCETALKRKSGKGEALRHKKLRVIEGLTLAEAGGRDLPLSSRTEYLSRAKVYLAVPSVNVDVNTSKSLHEFVLRWILLRRPTQQVRIMIMRISLHYVLFWILNKFCCTSSVQLLLDRWGGKSILSFAVFYDDLFSSTPHLQT